MTQAQALTALRERLDETTSAAWTDIELRRWINEGAQDLCQRTECLQAVATKAVTAGVRQYTITDRIVRINRVEFKPTGDSRIFPLEYRDFNSMDSIWYTQQAVHSSTPLYYTLWGYPPSLALLLYPTPPTTGMLTYRYYALPTALTTDGSQAAVTLSVPEGWESTVVDYAEYMALRKDLQPRWQEAKGLYEENVDKLMLLSRRWTDQNGVITPDVGGAMGLPAWLVSG